MILDDFSVLYSLEETLSAVLIRFFLSSGMKRALDCASSGRGCVVHLYNLRLESLESS